MSQTGGKVKVGLVNDASSSSSPKLAEPRMLRSVQNQCWIEIQVLQVICSRTFNIKARLR
jgi:hypothetical protein